MIDKRPVLLLIDDEEGIRTVLGLVIDSLGYNVRTAVNGQEGLEMFMRYSPDIVITDIRMPVMDGLTFLDAVKEYAPHAEVLVLTGHGDMDMAVECLRKGAGDFLHKPVADAALSVALERAMQRITMRETLRQYTENLEQLVQQRTKELIQSERFAAMGETAASLAHSIKNIAGALEGTMYVLEKGLQLNQREYFEQGWEMVRNDVTRLGTLAVDLLSLGQMRTPEYALHNPNAVAQDVIESLQVKAVEHGVQLVLHPAKQEQQMLIAEASVHQCLFNVVLNGIECFAGQQPMVTPPTVTVTVEYLPQEIRGNAVRYTIIDNGPGLPDAYVHGTAHNWHSSKDTGSGIGLFSTRKVAHEIGAELSFQTIQPHGTKVTLLVSEAKK